MKAYIPINKAQKRRAASELNCIVEKRLAAERDVFSMRVLGAMCIALHDIFGFGKIRLTRLMKRLTDELNDRDRWGEISDEVLAQNLSALGLAEYGERLFTASQNIDKIINEDWN